MTTRELLAEFATLMNEYGPTSAQADTFLQENQYNEEFRDLALLARRLKLALDAPVNQYAPG
jgi:hypothetical protein